MKIEIIATGSKPARLVTYAAKELAKYISLLFGHKPRIAVRPGKTRGITVVLDAKADGFSDQGYALRSIGHHTFEIAGGSPIAVMWGVYDLVERWGVRYELHGDILPDHPGVMKLPNKAIICEPDLKLRSFRTYNDFAQNECCWAAKDYELLLNQLVKMRYNGIMFCVRPYDPFIDLRFHGARKTLAAPNFGWEPKVLSHHPGYELFEQSGDANHSVFVNPDLTGHDNHDKATAAGRAYARKVFRMAHARGITCAVSAWCADFDPAIRKRIRELTLPKHKVKRSEAVRICYGIWREGPDVETGRCMSVKNPVFLDAIATNMQAHIDAFPDADRFTFSSTEFGGSDADCERAWTTLDRKIWVE